MKNEKLVLRFLKDIENNNKGNVRSYLRRIPALRAILLQKAKKHKIAEVPLFFGRQMKVVTGETVSSSLISFGYAEIALTALMLNTIKEGDNVVDVGAHYGYEAMLASVLVGEHGKVYSFEPNPASFKIASQNITEPNATVYNLAVGSHEGIVKMNHNSVENSAFNSIVPNDYKGNVIDVRIVTLDTALKDRNRPINFIKCDVEGFEIDVLKGATGIIATDKPDIVLEADMPENGKPSQRAIELKDYMSGLGYEAYSFDLVDQELQIGLLGSFEVGHANILFRCKSPL